MTNTHTNESGRSMIEMLGVLAIIGVLSVGGIAGYSQAMSKFKVSKTTDQVQTMVTNIRTLFAGQRSYAGLTGENAYTMGILTDETWDGAKATNAYGGEIILSTFTGDNPHYFAITYNDLPQDACVRMVMSDWGDASSGLVGLDVKGTAGEALEAVPNTAGQAFLTADKAVPLSLSDAVTACAKGAKSDNTSSISWIYR